MLSNSSRNVHLLRSDTCKITTVTCNAPSRSRRRWQHACSVGGPSASTTVPASRSSLLSSKAWGRSVHLRLIYRALASPRFACCIALDIICTRRLWFSAPGRGHEIPCDQRGEIAPPPTQQAEGLLYARFITRFHIAVVLQTPRRRWMPTWSSSRGSSRGSPVGLTLKVGGACTLRTALIAVKKNAH